MQPSGVGHFLPPLRAEQFVKRGQVFDLNECLKVQGVRGAIVFFTSLEKITVQQVMLLGNLQKAHSELVIVVVAQRLPSRSEVVTTMSVVKADYPVIFDRERAIYATWGVDANGMVIAIDRTRCISSRVALPSGILAGTQLNELKGKLEEIVRSIEATAVNFSPV